jgi:hypothetical protein
MAYCHTSNSRADHANPAAAKARRGGAADYLTLSCRFHTTTTKLSVLSLLKTKLDGCVCHICAVLVNIDMQSFSAQMEHVLVKHCLNIMISVVKLRITSCVDLKNTFLFCI